MILLLLQKLSKGALYHYYGSKKDLFISLIDHWETYTFQDFYDKKSEDKKASDILRFFAKNVIKTVTDKKHAYIAEIEFRAMSIQDSEIRERSNLFI